MFTLAMTVFVLAPLMFAFGALLTEAHALLVEIAAADKKGIVGSSSGWRTRHWSGRGSPRVGKVSSPFQTRL